MVLQGFSIYSFDLENEKADIHSITNSSELEEFMTNSATTCVFSTEPIVISSEKFDEAFLEVVP